MALNKSLSEKNYHSKKINYNHDTERSIPPFIYNLIMLLLS